jgi:nucleoside-diphosphate-sugar epimerase
VKILLSNDIQGSVGIVGCGWLGKALAKKLQQRHIPVLATSSQVCNVDLLNAQGIKAQQLMLPADEKQLAAHEVFSQHQLIIAITPKFKKGRADYPEKIAQLLTAAKLQGKVKRIILISSTGIYQGLSGLVNEQSSLQLTIDKVSLLDEAEQAVLAYHHQACVLRLAGLVGPERHPGNFLLAKKVLHDAENKVNLIHQADAVGLILSLLAQQRVQGIVNGVSDTHVSKKDYYQRAAKAVNLPLPVFACSSTMTKGRIVSGNKAKQLLNYSFVYPDLLAWL